MPILPLLLSVLAVSAVQCGEIYSREQLSTLLEILTGRVGQLEEKESIADEVGNLGDKLDEMGDKLTEGLEQLGETLAGKERPTMSTNNCDESQNQNSNQMLSCADVRRTDKTDGIHTLTVNNTCTQIKVFCDQQTAGGGWTVIQRRQDGSVDFNKTWKEYQKGFGDLNGEFWLGKADGGVSSFLSIWNSRGYTVKFTDAAIYVAQTRTTGLDSIHLLSKAENQTLRVDLEAFDGSTAYAEYNFFSIDGPDSLYRLRIGRFSGTAGNAMLYNNAKPFSTYDNDNSERDRCSAPQAVGWWFWGCTNCNLNGPYVTYAQRVIKGVVWFNWKEVYISLKHVEMKIRPAM